MSNPDLNLAYEALHFLSLAREQGMGIWVDDYRAKNSIPRRFNGENY